MYIRLYDRIWSDPNFKALDDKCKLAFQYFISCKHHNMLGLYHLPLAYICADMNWELEETQEIISKITDKKMIDFADDFMFVTNYLKYNPLGNPNQVKGAISVFVELESSKLLPKLLKAVEINDKGHSLRLITLLKTRIGIKDKPVKEEKPEKPEKPAKTPKKNVFTTAIDYPKEVEKILESFGEAKEDLVAFLDTVRQENKTKVLAASRAFTILKELKSIGSSNADILKGTRAAIQAGVPNHKYIIKVAKNNNERKNNGNDNKPATISKYSGLVEE